MNDEQQAKAVSGISDGGNIFEDKSQNTPPRPIKHKNKVITIIALILIVLISTLVYFIAPKADEDQIAEGEKVLTTTDLEDAEVELTSETSDASVENLTKELKAKIESQIAAGENPAGTAQRLASVLSNTSNEKRQDQLSDFIFDFLENHEDALWLDSDYYGVPDEFDVNYWKAQFYASLAYNYEFIMINEYRDSSGQVRDTTQEQLKYIDLYLALAADSANREEIPSWHSGLRQNTAPSTWPSLGCFALRTKPSSGTS
jgi:hypothetical protein